MTIFFRVLTSKTLNLVVYYTTYQLNPILFMQYIHCTRPTFYLPFQNNLKNKSVLPKMLLPLIEH